MTGQTTLSREERINRLDTLIAEDRILRGSWTGEANGRELACLLAAVSPEAGQARSADACPSSLMPLWLAYLTVWLSDNPSARHWPMVVRRYAALARRWHVLDYKAWRRLEYAVGAEILRAGRPTQADEWSCQAAVDKITALFDRAATGEVITQEAWTEASLAATTAAEAAGEVWELAAWAWEVRRLAETTAARESAAARRLAEAATARESAAEKAEWKVWESAAWALEVRRLAEETAAPESAAADKIADVILDTIESAITARVPPSKAN